MEQASHYYIYEHRRARDGEVFYVGKGQNKRAWSKSGRNQYWRRTVAKYGYVVEILGDASGLTEEEAHRVERELIAHYRHHGARLANLTDGGEGASGRVCSKETSENISASLRGKNLSEDHRRRISSAHTGMTRTDETRRAISDGLRGRIRTEDHKKALSESRRGKFCCEKHPRYNPEILTFESIATGERFELTRLKAREQIGFSYPELAGLLTGRRKTTKGYRLIRA